MSRTNGDLDVIKEVRFFTSAEIYTNPHSLVLNEGIMSYGVMSGTLSRFESSGESTIFAIQLGVNLVLLQDRESSKPLEIYDLTDSLLETVPHPITHLPTSGFTIRGTRCYVHKSIHPEFEVTFFCENQEIVANWISSFKKHSNATQYARPSYKMTKSGYMKKLPINYASRRRKFFYTWKKRFFVLAGPIIYYYSEENEKKRQLKGEFDIANQTLIKDPPLPKYLDQKLSFELKGDHTTISITCYSHHEREAWISSIERVLRGDFFVDEGEPDPTSTPAKTTTKTNDEDVKQSPAISTSTGSFSSSIDDLQSTSKNMSELAGKYMTAAITLCGSLLVWGRLPQREYGNFKLSRMINSENDYKVVPVLGPPITALRVTHVSVGMEHISAITEDGALYTFGIGRHGRLGHGDEVDTPMPRRVKALIKEVVVLVSSGWSHTACLTREGRMYTFGKGKERQLGTGNVHDVHAPHRVTSLSGEFVEEVSCGSTHTLCLTRTGTVYQFGTVMGMVYAKPRVLAQVSGKKMRITRITSGLDVSFALAANGTLFSWGRNDVGQLGLRSTEIHKSPARLPVAEQKFSTVSSRFLHSAAVSSRAELFTWGSSENGRLGHGDTDEKSLLSPRFVYMLQGRSPRTVSAGYNHTIVISDDGALYVFGSTEYGKLTHELPEEGSEMVDIPKSVLVDFIFEHSSWQRLPIPTISDPSDIRGTLVTNRGSTSRKNSEVRKRRSSMCSKDDLKTLLSAIELDSPKSLDGASECEDEVSSAFLVDSAYERKMRSIDVIPGDKTERCMMPRQRVEAAGSRLSAAISPTGKLYLSGKLEKCMLPTDSTNFILQHDLSAGLKEVVTSISLGPSHILVTTESNLVYSWGHNGHGRLGHGSESKEEATVEKPKAIAFLTGKEIVTLSAGHEHSLFVSSSGTVFSCGSNSHFQLGFMSGASETIHTPKEVDVFLRIGVVMYSVSAGKTHSLGYTMEGDVWVWGSQGVEELSERLPRKVKTFSRARGISAGVDMSLVVSENGDVYEWGENAPSGSSEIPRAVEDVSDIVSISAGWDHWIALSRNCICYLFCNKNGKDLFDVPDVWISPQKVKNPVIEQSNIVSVNAGKTHCIVFTDAGVMLTWGLSKYGQCGYNVEKASSPRVVEVFERFEDVKKSIFLTCGTRHFPVTVRNEKRRENSRKDLFKTIRGKTAQMPPGGSAILSSSARQAMRGPNMEIEMWKKKMKTEYDEERKRKSMVESLIDDIDIQVKIKGKNPVEMRQPTDSSSVDFLGVQVQAGDTPEAKAGTHDDIDSNIGTEVAESDKKEAPEDAECDKDQDTYESDDRTENDESAKIESPIAGDTNAKEEKPPEAEKLDVEEDFSEIGGTKGDERSEKEDPEGNGKDGNHSVKKSRDGPERVEDSGAQCEEVPIMETSTSADAAKESLS